MNVPLAHTPIIKCKASILFYFPSYFVLLNKKNVLWMVEKNQVISNFFQNSESNPLIKFFGLYDVNRFRGS